MFIILPFYFFVLETLKIEKKGSIKSICKKRKKLGKSKIQNICAINDST